MSKLMWIGIPIEIPPQLISVETLNIVFVRNAQKRNL
jgi:hypothetical protein